MPVNGNHEDDSSENEMAELRNSSDCSVPHRVKVVEFGGESQRIVEKHAAYRKLYGIITMMTMILFVLNIVQVCLLKVVSNYYWIVLFPGIIFAFFTTWACVFVYFNWKSFHQGSWNFRAGRKNAIQHLGALFLLKGRSERSRQRIDDEPNWPIRFTRAGILLTIFLSVILCQFVYLPIWAVPAFRKMVWKMELRADESVTTPAFALLQDTSNPRRAVLEDNTTTINQLCAEKSSIVPKQYCFKYHGEFSYGGSEPSNLRYSIFDGRDHPKVGIGETLDPWYQYSYHGNVSQDPVLSLAVFDSDLIPFFPLAYQCGIITATLLPAGKRVQTNLQQIAIKDVYNVLDRQGDCAMDLFVRYRVFDVNVILLGEASGKGYINCNLDEERFNGSCNGDLTTTFTLGLARNYSSDHGKDWITILTDEGGVLGFVAFLTWFFTIFQI